MNKITLLLAVTIALNTVVPASAYVAFSRDYPKSGLDVELDPYYVAVETYYNLSAQQGRLVIDEEDESKIYRTLLTKSLKPEFILLEASCYPMPILGVEIKQQHPALYRNFDVTENLNLVRAVCTGFEEPAALSLLFGNLVHFKSKDIPDAPLGKGYAGYLFSAGTYHIKDNSLVDDYWLEVEWKVKGEKISKKQRLKWSLRTGTKQHEHPDIKDTVYFSFFRDRVDFKGARRFFLDNASLEYKLELDAQSFRIIRHFFLVGKAVPMKEKRLAFQLKWGFIVNMSDSYRGALAAQKPSDEFSIMIRPNIRF